MSIQIDPAGKIFKLDTLHTSYVMCIDALGYPAHLHYGSTVDDLQACTALSDWFDGASFTPTREDGEPCMTRSTAMQECTTNEYGDFRSSSIAVRTMDGCNTTDPRYVSHRVFPGKPELPGLPSARVNELKDVETLELVLADPLTKVEFHLFYSVFPERDVITRSMKVVNPSAEPVYVERVMSACLDLPRNSFDFIQASGSWARERYPERTPLRPGLQSIYSKKTSTGHMHNCAFALVDHSATETTGEAYGMELVYSGSFAAEVDADTFGRVRAMIGVNPETFEWKLEPGESFQSPEAILTYSAQGVGGMSRNLHDMLRFNLIRPTWALKERPILVNNWEATYFNFTGDKLVRIAEDAAKLGIEMLVLDDGWFGHRNDDHSSLGDWFVNESKVGKLSDLVNRINALGVKFGLWFEPEMISDDSELHRAHPEWLLTVPGRQRTMGRTQFVLNMANPDVVDYLFKTISGVLHSANIEYIKWDMNRQPSEKYFDKLPADRQKEIGHRFVLGVYELHRRLLDEFPNLLIEGCSGGGGRFDAGILYYAPQIWTSDNSDAVERLTIQYGTSLFYPPSAMGAHVSVCPNHQTSRVTPFSTRGNVAMSGTFGYELDLNLLSDEDRALVKDQTAMYHRIHSLVTHGDYYRLINPGESRFMTAWEFAAKDASEAFMVFVQPQVRVCRGSFMVRLQGLDPKSRYQLEGTEQVFFGNTLMNAGFAIPRSIWNDAGSGLFHFKKI